MKINELIVGDWVNMGNPVTDELVPTKIENIYGEEINCKTGHTSDDVPTIIYGKWLRYAQPIPLTEDILLKNGFKKTTNDWNRHRPLIIFGSMEFPTISIHADMDMKHFWVHGTIDLTYVHQLQHLLRLCGIEKEIEL